MKTGTVYEANGNVETIAPANGKSFTVEELQRIVKGTFDIQRLPGTTEVIILNDDGRRLNLLINKNASAVWRRAYPESAYPVNNVTELVGDVLVCDIKLVQ